VHKAVLISGETPAVKVRRPGVLKQVRTGIEIMQYLFEAICRKISEMKICNLTPILDEFQIPLKKRWIFPMKLRKFYLLDSTNLPFIYLCSKLEINV